MTESSSLRPSDGARKHAVDSLSDAFTNDQISMEEFERRVARVHTAKSADVLKTLLADLRTSNVPATSNQESQALGHPGTATVPSTRVREHERAIAILSETKREGRWIPARTTQVVAFLGSSIIDLREAMLGPGETVIKVVATLGSVEIIIPPSLNVESVGSAVMGTFEARENQAHIEDPAVPRLRVEGISVLGEVTVEVRLPGETKREAKKRRRRVARQLRDDQKRLKRGG